MTRNRWISAHSSLIPSFIAGVVLAGLLVAAAGAQVPVLNMDATEWSKQQMEAEARRLRSEYTPREDVQQEIAALFETRRRMSAEEDRRLGPAGVDSDPLRGTSDFSREVEAQRQRSNSERWQ